MKDSILSEAIARLDELHNRLDGLAKFASAKRWPPPLQAALAAVASEVETVAGGLDAAGDEGAGEGGLAASVGDALQRAMLHLGEAFAADLAAAVEDRPHS